MFRSFIFQFSLQSLHVSFKCKGPKVWQLIQLIAGRKNPKESTNVGEVPVVLKLWKVFNKAYVCICHISHILFHSGLFYAFLFSTSSPNSRMACHASSPQEVDNLAGGPKWSQAFRSDVKVSTDCKYNEPFKKQEKPTNPNAMHIKEPKNKSRKM